MRWWRKEREQDLEREIRADLELEAREQQEKGLSPEEARYAARRAFGNLISWIIQVSFLLQHANGGQVPEVHRLAPFAH